MHKCDGQGRGSGGALWAQMPYVSVPIGIASYPGNTYHLCQPALTDQGTRDELDAMASTVSGWFFFFNSE